MAGQDDWRWLQGVCVGGGGRPPGEAAGAGEAAIRWAAATTVLVCQCGLDGRGTRAHYGARFRARSDGALWGSRGADTAQNKVSTRVDRVVKYSSTEQKRALLSLIE